jgi:peptidoglycan/LPS O-acetylase OafA/YrhL
MIPSLMRAAIGFLAGVMLYRANRCGFLARLPSINRGIVFAVWFLICLIPDWSRMPIFESVAALVAAPLSVALLIKDERPLPRLYAILGTLSYPLYASHFAIVNLALIWLVPKSEHNLLFLIPMLVAALLLAWGIERSTATLRAAHLSQRALALYGRHRHPGRRCYDRPDPSPPVRPINQNGRDELCIVSPEFPSLSANSRQECAISK